MECTTSLLERFDRRFGALGIAPNPIDIHLSNGQWPFEVMNDERGQLALLSALSS